MQDALSRKRLRHDAAMTNNSITLYGIGNCDTVKKARQWLDEHGLAYTFHDFKLAGVPPAPLDQWLAHAGWESLLNRKGTTWRKLDEKTRESAVDSASARAIMLANPSVIKRPVVAWGGSSNADVTVGFKADTWESRLP